MFQDVDIKFQVQMYREFDVNVLEHTFFTQIVTIVITRSPAAGSNTADSKDGVLEPLHSIEFDSSNTSS